METPGITAVLIVKNEEKLIGRCLRSVKELDEVVVLDTGSTDRTAKICAELGARVSQTEKIEPFHFAEARNRALAEVRTPWAFSIDADEVLRPGAIRKMRKAVAEAGDKTAFTLTFINQPEGSKGARSYITHKIKLFRKDAWTWKYRVHEQLEKTRDGEAGKLETASVEHIPSPDKSARHGQNLELLKLCIKENPEYIRAFKHLGQELMLQQKDEEAIPYLVHYVEKTEEGSLEVSVVLTNIGCCLGNLGKLDECLTWLERAADVDRRRREPLYLAAMYTTHCARTIPQVERAMAYLGRLLKISQTDRPQSSNDWPAAWGSEPLRMLTSCRESLKQLQEREPGAAGVVNP